MSHVYKWLGRGLSLQETVKWNVCVKISSNHCSWWGREWYSIFCWSVCEGTPGNDVENKLGVQEDHLGTSVIVQARDVHLKQQLRGKKEKRDRKKKGHHLATFVLSRELIVSTWSLTAFFPWNYKLRLWIKQLLKWCKTVCMLHIFSHEIKSSLNISSPLWNNSIVSRTNGLNLETMWPTSSITTRY